MNDRKPNLVIYHGHCADGMASCVAALHGLGTVDTECIAGLYDEPVPHIDTFRLRNIYIVDFSYSEKVIREIAAVATKVVVLDHHKTAQAALVGPVFPANVEVLFDMNRSGAGITWDYFHPGVERPRLIDYVEDRDLWKWKLELTKEINAYIGLQDTTVVSYLGLLDELDNDRAGMFDKAAEMGRVLIKQSEKTTGKICQLAFEKQLPSPKGTKRVMFINTCTMISEVGNALLERHPNIDFVAGWWDKSDRVRIWSLRAANKYDVSALAKIHGGGGHANAAGFNTSTNFMLSELP